MAINRAGQEWPETVTLAVMVRNETMGYFPSVSEFNEPFETIFDRITPFKLHIRDGRLEPCVPCWMTYEEFDRHVIRKEPIEA